MKRFWIRLAQVCPYSSGVDAELTLQISRGRDVIHGLDYGRYPAETPRVRANSTSIFAALWHAQAALYDRTKELYNSISMLVSKCDHQNRERSS
jgi:hypothetical protein